MAFLGDSTASVIPGVTPYPELAAREEGYTSLVSDMACSGMFIQSYDKTVFPWDATEEGICLRSPWSVLVAPVLNTGRRPAAYHVLLGVNDAIFNGQAYSVKTKAEFVDAMVSLQADLGRPLFVGVPNTPNCTSSGNAVQCAASLVAFADAVSDTGATGLCANCPDCWLGADISDIDCGSGDCADNFHPSSTEHSTIIWPRIKAALETPTCPGH